MFVLIFSFVFRSLDGIIKFRYLVFFLSSPWKNNLCTWLFPGHVNYFLEWSLATLSHLFLLKSQYRSPDVQYPEAWRNWAGDIAYWSLSRSMWSTCRRDLQGSLVDSREYPQNDVSDPGIFPGRHRWRHMTRIWRWLWWLRWHTDPELCAAESGPAIDARARWQDRGAPWWAPSYHRPGSWSKHRCGCQRRRPDTGLCLRA